MAVRDTLSRIEDVLLSTSIDIWVERRSVAGTRFVPLAVHFLNSDRPGGIETYFGKGLDDDQRTASAVMEFFEGLSSRMIGAENLVVSTFPDLGAEARDPREFVLAHDFSYRRDRVIEWVWGYSLTEREPVLVPANLVFFPYEVDDLGKAIAATDSNGLAAGNCLEEAVLHGLLEVVERDARMIMEYGAMTMPDLELDAALDPALARLVTDVGESRVKMAVKDDTLDIPIPTIGVFLDGMSKRRQGMSFASGAHPDPSVAVSRALTEAIQLYPRCRNYEDWIASGPRNHLYRPGQELRRLSDMRWIHGQDLRSVIESCVGLLRHNGSEVIVVDLTLPEIGFPVVRVLATGLQPLMTPSCLRISKRLLEVPAALSYSDKPAKASDVRFKSLCGFADKNARRR